MANDAERAEFWKGFILSKCQYPASERLRAQFEAAALHDFCPCGCNSFQTTVPSRDDLPGLVPPNGSGVSGLVFEADFRMSDGRQLEVLLFAGEDGNLTGVDVQCQGNTDPVPDVVRVDEEPFNVWMNQKLFRE